MLTHVIWCFGAGSLSLVCFYSKPINFFVLLICVTIAAYNAGTYLFEYMVKHYERGIKSSEFIEHPDRIISFDFGELVESIGSGRSAFTMPSEEEMTEPKPDSFIIRFIKHMVKM